MRSAPSRSAKQLVPTPELDVRSRQRVVALDDGGVEGHHQRGVDEVQQVGHRRPQALDADGVDAVDGLDHGFGRVAAFAGMQQARESALVVGVFVDVGNAQLGFPQEGVVSPLEDLPLFGDGPHHNLERRASVHIAEAAAVDLAHYGAQPAADRTEVLQAFVPEEPAAVGGTGVSLPALDQGPEAACGYGHQCGRQCRRHRRHHCQDQRCSLIVIVAGAAVLLLHIQQ